jgi:hypothetical protein
MATALARATVAIVAKAVAMVIMVTEKAKISRP